MKPALALVLGLGTTELVALHTLITPHLLAPSASPLPRAAAGDSGPRESPGLRGGGGVPAIPPSPSPASHDREHPAAVVAALPSPRAAAGDSGLRESPALRRGGGLPAVPPAPSPLYFAYDRATIFPVAAAELDRIGDALAAHPELTLVITAHACAAGTDGHNLALSSRRARRVIEHLMARGIPAHRLIPRARGERDAHDDRPDDRRDPPRRPRVRGAPVTLTVAWVACVLLSLVGAATFFAAGRISHRAPATPPDPAHHELARLRLEHAQTLADQRRLGDEVLRLATTAPAPPPAPAVDPEATVLRRRLADADELRAENARLRHTATEAARLAGRVTQLEHELAETVRKGVATQLAPAPAAATTSPGAPVAAALAATLASGGLDELVRQLAADPRFGAVVISDELGLLVAGAGERAEELAALGGYLAGVGDRARELAGLGAPTRIVIEDDRHATLAAVHLPGGTLVAVTVSRAPAAAVRPPRPAPARSTPPGPP